MNQQRMVGITFVIVAILGGFSQCAGTQDKYQRMQETTKHRAAQRAGTQVNFSKMVGVPGSQLKGMNSGTSNIPSGGNRSLGFQSGYTPIKTGRSDVVSPSPTTNKTGAPTISDELKARAMHGREAQAGDKTVIDGSREAQMKKLFDPASGLQDVPGGKGRPFQSSKTDLGTRSFGKDGIQEGAPGVEMPTLTPLAPGRGAGKNTSSKLEQQSSDPSEKIYDKDGNYMGTRGELERDYDAEMWGDIPKEQRAAFVKEQEEFRRAGIKNEAEARAMKEQQERELKGQMQESSKKADGGKKTPTPDTVDESHLPIYLQHQREQKSMIQHRVEEGQKVEMTDENKRQIVRSPRTQQELRELEVVKTPTVNEQTRANQTNPVDGDGTNTGANPNDPSNPVKHQPKPGTEPGGGDPDHPDE